MATSLVPQRPAGPASSPARTVSRGSPHLARPGVSGRSQGQPPLSHHGSALSGVVANKHNNYAIST